MKRAKLVKVCSVLADEIPEWQKREQMVLVCRYMLKNGKEYFIREDPFNFFDALKVARTLCTTRFVERHTAVERFLKCYLTVRVALANGDRITTKECRSACHLCGKEKWDVKKLKIGGSKIVAAVHG